MAVDQTLSPSDLLEHLWNLIADQPDDAARNTVAALKAFRLSLIDKIVQDPTDLIKWLYENQGERRFDASNRLFLVLVNEGNFFQSWQLKRNRTLLSNGIGNYLDKIPANPGRNIEFHWKGSLYNTRADVIVIRHASALN